MAEGDWLMHISKPSRSSCLRTFVPFEFPPLLDRHAFDPAFYERDAFLVYHRPTQLGHRYIRFCRLDPKEHDRVLWFPRNDVVVPAARSSSGCSGRFVDTVEHRIFLARH